MNGVTNGDSSELLEQLPSRSFRLSGVLLENGANRRNNHLALLAGIASTSGYLLSVRAPVIITPIALSDIPDASSKN
uniref:Uncharacterized protein n=1 Tax=Salmonella sp. TaxID=599 RepID=A0A482ET76_SALSP|nr:hypothetical protein [Salmonella sp.]QBM91397.1 hypothetical protein NNIBIDOC_00067 [Salmonella sp.]